MILPTILFFTLAILAVASAVGLLFSRNAVIAALFLILNFLSVAILYLILAAPFIAVAQVTVYAGAIMVLFLFVIMLLGAEQAGHSLVRWWLQPLSLVLGGLLLIEIVVIVLGLIRAPQMTAVLPENFGSPQSIGEVLFSQYALPFEATGILLLIAMVGAIVITRPEKN
jgi:NADH-quinone oxidoreductase subunit J